MLVPVAPEFSASDFQFNEGDLKLLQEADLLDVQLEWDGLVYEDAETTHYVESVGRSVLPPGPPPEHVKWQFRVLREAELNAFALPNGSVYVNTGLLALLQNEAQLAAVLAHEEAHVLERHSYLERRGRHKKAVAVGILKLAGGVAGSGFGLSGLAVSAISSVASDLLVATVFGYDRKMESEADMSGLEALRKAGYQPDGMVGSFQLLAQEAGEDSSPALYRDHPRLEMRIQYVTQAIQANPPGTGPLRVGAEDYSVATENVCRHDFQLELLAGQPRRAVAVAQHLVDDHPTAENYSLLGDAYWAMGGRPPDPSTQQLSSERKQAAKKLQTMTRREYEHALLAEAQGQDAWKENREKAESSYQKALQADPSNAEAFRGLGFVYEDEGKNDQAIVNFRKYLQMAPQAWDRTKIQGDLGRLQTAAGAH
jgi:predicted Zn-dependent protease